MQTLSTHLIGREKELAEIGQLLADPACRLLTLVGPGGIGKTRLAQEVALLQQGAFDSGVYFVPLQPLASPELIYPTIADQFRFSALSVDDPTENLLNHLREKHMLLVLDNFEHLVEGADLLAAILDIAPHVKLLVTSRERLKLREEWVFDVTGLPYPHNGHIPAPDDYSAVRLFTDHARRAGYTPVVADSAAIARICQLVEGIPLAIELAAAWVRVLPCGEIAQEIARSQDILTTNVRGVPDKHRSMRAAFDYSWNLLSADEQAVFSKLAVFRGGFAREAAAQVAGASLLTLASLVDKSLLRMDAAGRYSLQELLRQDAEQHLIASGLLDATRNAHSAYYAALLDRLGADLKGSDQVRALDEIEANIDNVRAAWNWAIRQSKAHEIAQSLDSLARYYLIRSRFVEAMEMLELALNRFEGEETELLAYLLLWYGAFLETVEAFDLMQRGLTILRQHGVEIVPVIPLRRFLPPAFIEGFGGDAALYQFYQTQLAFAREGGDDWSAAWLLACMGELAASLAKHADAQALLHESLSGFRTLGDGWATSLCMGHMGWIAQHRGQHQEALYHFQQQLALCKVVGDIGGMAVAITQIGVALEALGEPGTLNQQLADALQLSLEVRIEWVTWVTLLWAAEHFASAKGQAEKAVELFACLHKHFGHWPHKREVIEHYLDSLWAELSPEGFAEAVRKGESLSPEAATTALLQLLSLPEKPAVVPPLQPLVDPLTERELDVLRLMADGLSNREIAERLVLATGTVKAHSSGIFSKLDTNNRVQAVNRAKELGLI